MAKGRRRKRKMAAKYKRRRAMVVIVLVAIVIAVCYVIDAIQRREENALAGKNANTASLINTPGVSQPKTYATSDGKASDNPAETPASTPGKNSQTGGTSSGASNELDFSAVLYFPDSDFNYLVKENISLKYKGPVSKASEINTADKVKISLEALTNGPKNDTSRTFIPQGTKVLDVKINGKSAVINFSKELKDKQAASSLPSRMALGQIILTCSEYNIDEVLIEVEGKIVEDYPGGADLSKPIKKSDYAYLIY